MFKHLKASLPNTALMVASFLVFYVIGELVFFRLMLPHLSLNMRPFLPDRADFFLQGSKSHHAPRDYIALVGDSYAQGLGDWVLSIGGKKGLPHHSADIIHEMLDTDVVSFGRGASGSAHAMVLRTSRILGDSYCFLFPAIDDPKRFLIYFYEGNDIDDNVELLQHSIRPAPGDIRPQIDRFLNQEFAGVSPWRCHGHFGNTFYRMARYLWRYGWEGPKVLDAPVGSNQVLVAGVSVGAAPMQVPSMALDDAAIDAGVIVYERSLAWLRRAYPEVPMTVVYLPSPASVYRHTRAEVVSAGIYVPVAAGSTAAKPEYADGRPFPAAAIYRNSQTICEKIRGVSLSMGTEFIDSRAAIRSAASKQLLHGPRDWTHFNETGYRALGALVASRLGQRPADPCNDQWETDSRRAGRPAE